jgi:hypothetical protein
VKLQRKLGLALAGVLAAATLAMVSASPALAAGRLRITGNCGDTLVLNERVVGQGIKVTITIPSTDPTEVWSIKIIQQEYGSVTGGRIGAPIDQTAAFPPLVFSAAANGFASDGGQVTNTAGLTHQISYTATRTFPSPLTCSNTGFWTNPGGASDGPTAENPTARPDAPPKFAGDSEADAGTNDALLLMDQEMLATAQGIPAGNRFAVRVNGVARTVTAVQVINDDPPNQAVLDLTFSGLPLVSGDAVTVQYSRPLVGNQAALQDLENLKTANFGPISITAL